MNKRSKPLCQKSNFSPPGSDEFLNFFITPPKTFQLSLGVAGKENTDVVSFVTILPIFAKRPDYLSVYSDKNYVCDVTVSRYEKYTWSPWASIAKAVDSVPTVVLE